MSMIIDKEKNILRFDIPNSEAALDAQHNGIKERTVGQYYMSDNYEGCFVFLAELKGDFYIDLSLSINNAKNILTILENKNYFDAFKTKLIAQSNQIKALEWSLKNEKNYFYKINPPTINDQKKYLKLDNSDSVLTAFKTLLLGDLCSLYFKKIGDNGFVIYLDKNPNFDEIISSNKILHWMV